MGGRTQCDGILRTPYPQDALRVPRRQLAFSDDLGSPFTRGRRCYRPITNNPWQIRANLMRPTRHGSSSGTLRRASFRTSSWRTTLTQRGSSAPAVGQWHGGRAPARLRYQTYPRRPRLGRGWRISVGLELRYKYSRGVKLHSSVDIGTRVLEVPRWDTNTGSIPASSLRSIYGVR